MRIYNKVSTSKTISTKSSTRTLETETGEAMTQRKIIKLNPKLPITIREYVSLIIMSLVAIIILTNALYFGWKRR